MRHLRFLWVALVTGILLPGCSALSSNLPSTGETVAATPVGEVGAFVQVVAGFVHTCALKSDGSAACWGNNDYSQLGTNIGVTACDGRPCSRVPVTVSGGLHFTSLAAGWVQNCGIATDRRTYCWGGGAIGRNGYLGDGQLRRSLLPVRVVADSFFVSTTLGDGHACALTESGMAFCWGQNGRGQLGDGTTRDRATPIPVATNHRFTSLSAGAYHTCGVTLGNEAYCWGDNRWGMLGIGNVGYNALIDPVSEPSAVAGGHSVAAIAAGWEHTCALTTSGETYCWGRNDDASQLGDASQVTHRGVPGRISNAAPFTALSAGVLATCGRTAANDVYCWGGNYYGGLGNGSSASRGVGRPVRTLGGPFANVALGQGHTCGLREDRRLYCWGDQSAGQY